MCGIIGEYSSNNSEENFLYRCDKMSHRGPDARGYRSLLGGKIKLGHRRLSIIDLNTRSNQPMEIEGYVIVYNGEVYNYRELSKKLKSKCHTTSDTEVILRTYIEQGVGVFAQLEGMFKVAIFDPREHKIMLARDRMGI